MNRIKMENSLFFEKGLLLFYAFFSALLINLFCSHVSFAQDNLKESTDSKPNTSIEIEAPAKKDNYSTSEILNRILTFEEEKTIIEQKLQSLHQIDLMKEQIENLVQEFELFKSALDQKKKLSSWSSLKIDDFLVNANQFHERKEEIKSQYFAEIKQIENFSQELEQKQAYFNRAKKTLDKSIVEEQIENFREIKNFLLKKSEELSRIQEAYASNYQKFQKKLEVIEQVKENLDKEKEQFQASLFIKSHSALYEKDFWESETEALSQEVNASWQSLTDLKIEKIREDFFAYLASVIIFITLYILLKKLKKAYQFPNPPFAFSFLCAVICSNLLVKYPPSIINIIAWVLVPIFLYRLVKSYNFSKVYARLFLGLFVAYAFIRVVESIDFPILLYRLFIVLFSGIMASIAFYQYFKIRKKKEHPFAINFSLSLSAISFLLVSVADLFGFHLFAIFLLHGLIKTAFLLFALLFFKKVFYQFLFFLLQLPQVKKIKVLYKNRSYILKRLSHLLLVILTVVIVIWVPSIWQYYSSFSESAKAILSAGISLGEKKITLKMLLEAGLLFYLAHIAAFFLCSILQTEVYPRKDIERGVGNSINSLVKYSLLIVGTFLAFFALGFQLQQLAIIAGALSVGIGFGLQNIINNFVSGIILLFERPIKVGDLLDIGGQWGEVEKVGLRSTIIRTFSKTQLIIPNSTFITETVTNLTLSDNDYRIVIPVGIAYGSDTKKAHQALTEIVENHPGILQDPKPMVFFKAFGDSSLNFEVFVWFDDITQKAILTSEILFAIDAKFRELEIEIPFPQRDLHLRSIDEKTLESLKGSK